jgi:hypothetical protein
MSSALTEKIPATRVTFVVDDYTFRFLQEAYTHTTSDELWVWEYSEDIQYDVFLPCEDCGDRYQMENYACPNNQGYCVECCECDEHSLEVNND